MVMLTKNLPSRAKKVHCPICGARLCDVKCDEEIYINYNSISCGIVIKCYKCRNKFNVSIK